VAKLSAKQIYDLARQAGLSQASAIVATAVALGESSGNTMAHNTNAATGDNSYGLWQINMLGTLGPDRRAKLGLASNEDLFDPATNARAMALISARGANFSPWSVYRSGEYRSHTAEAAKAANAKSIPGRVIDGARDFIGEATGLDAVGEAITSGTRDLVTGARNVAVEGAFLALGLGLVAAGLWKATEESRRKLADRSTAAAGTAAKAAVTKGAA
jgi:hypothetical protein